MKKAFLSNLLLLLFFNLLIKPLYIFGIDRTIQNKVGEDAYGMYFTWFNFTFIFQIISDLGTTYFNNSYLSQNRHLLNKYFPSIFQLKIILSLIYIVVCVLAGQLFGYGGVSFYLMVAIQLLISMILFLRTNISGMGFYKLDSYVSVADKLFLILALGIMLFLPNYFGNISIERFIQTQFWCYLLLLMLLIGINKKIGVSFFGKIDYSKITYFFQKSYPFAIVVILMSLYTRSDAIFIEKLLPDGAFHAGVYAAAYRLLDAANMIGYLFAALLLPMFARLLKTKENLEELLQTSLKIIVSFSIGFSIAVFVWRNDLIRMLNHEANEYWGNVLGFLMLTFIPVSINYIFGTFLTAKQSLKKMYPIFLIGILINVGLNLLLIPHYQALGAALSTLVTQLFIAWRQVRLTILETNFDFSFVFKKIVLYSFGVVVWSIFNNTFLLSFDWKVAFLFNGLIIVIWTFMSKLLKFEDFKTVI